MIGGKIIRGPVALEGVDFEGGEFHRIVKQTEAAIGHEMGHVGADPIEHRHEIVDDGRDAFRREVGEAGPVMFEQRLEIAGSGLDVLVDRQGFHDGPAQAV